MLRQMLRRLTHAIAEPPFPVVLRPNCLRNLLVSADQFKGELVILAAIFVILLTCLLLSPIHWK